MRYSNDVEQAVKSIRYYSDKIKDAVKKQFDDDFGAVNPEIAERRFESLGVMQTNSEWLNVYCDNIMANLKRAEETEKTFRSKEEFIVNGNTGSEGTNGT